MLENIQGIIVCSCACADLVYAPEERDIKSHHLSVRSIVPLSVHLKQTVSLRLSKRTEVNLTFHIKVKGNEKVFAYKM